MKFKHLPLVLLFGLVISCSSEVKKETIKVSLANDLIMDYWDNYTKYYSSEYMMDLDQYYPEPLRYEFERKSDITKRELYISMNEDMSDSVKYTTSDRFIDIPYLFANTNYYVMVYEYNGNKLVNKGEVQPYYTLDYPRTLEISFVSNTRDIGNLPTEDGHRLAQGKIYRGANLDKIEPDGEDILGGELGINTDLDLRKVGEGLAGYGSPVYGMNYINISAPMYVEGEGGIRSSTQAVALRREIQVFADPYNYPVYFHCAIGRDRTGTLAIILESLLGVDAETVLKEYELSFLSSSGYSSDVPVEELVDKANDVIGYIILKGQESPTDSLAECTKNWLINDIGVTEEEINSIKEIMLV